MKPSVMIPTFNRPHLVKTAIRSALEQTVPCDVVVVDSGTEHADLSEFEGRIKYIQFPYDYITLAWQVGVAATSGEACIICQDDDWLMPTCIERMLPRLEDPRVGYVFCCPTIEGVGGFDWKPYELHHFPKSGPISGAMMEDWLMRSGLGLSPGSVLFRRQDLLDNLFTGRIPGSPWHFPYVGGDLLVSLIPTSQYLMVYYLDEVLVGFGAHYTSITTNTFAKKKQRLLLEEYEALKTYWRSIKHLYQMKE